MSAGSRKRFGLTTARAILTNYGYTLLVANNVAEAQIWAASHPGAIHLLLTDMAVAGTSGREIARQVCATRRETRVLYIAVRYARYDSE